MQTKAESIDASQAKDANGTAIDSGPVGLGTCASPIDIPSGVDHVDVTVSTTGAAHIFDFPCASNGADLVLRVKVASPQPQLIYADTFGATWNTALFFSDACDTPVASADMDTVCNDDACGTSQSQASAALSYGYHYLIVSGANGESGDVTVHIEAAALGTGPTVALPRARARCKGLPPEWTDRVFATPPVRLTTIGG